jgi:hypothetical protein
MTNDDSECIPAEWKLICASFNMIRTDRWHAIASVIEAISITLSVYFLVTITALPAAAAAVVVVVKEKSRVHGIVSIIRLRFHKNK